MQDDAIASFMNEWSQQQGISGGGGSSSAAGDDNSKSRIAKRRIIPELQNYPNNYHLAGSHSIWNPLVQSPTEFDQRRSDQDEFYGFVISTNPQVEVLRRRAYETFKRDCQECFQRVLKPWDLKLPFPSILEKWHMDAKHSEQKRFESSMKGPKYPLLARTSQINAWTRQDFDNYFDPILLCKDASQSISPILKEEALRAWKLQKKGSSSSSSNGPQQPPKLAKKLVQLKKALVPLIINSRENFAKQLQQAANQSAMRSSGSRTKLPKVEVVQNIMHVSFVGNSFKVHEAYYVKLQRLFDRHQQRRKGWDDETNEYTFEEALFCVLCRYDMLQGAGLQAGVPGAIMDVLLDKLQCRMECFASPLNCRYERFASAFELDKLFGSFSSFFHLTNLPMGCYQANPPFCEGVIGALSTKLERLFSNSSEPLMFVVFVPAWKESNAYSQLLEHKFLTKHILLEQGKHWYAEGTQHRRKDSFRVASFDTSIFIYQNDSAKLKWPVDEQLIESLNDAFCRDPGTMIKSAVGPTKTVTNGPTSEERFDNNKDSKVDKAFSKAKSHSTPSKQKPNRGKKRKFVNQEDENRAHLELLQSLGLTSNSTETPAEQGNENSGTKSFMKKKSKKKSKKKK